MGFLSNLLGRSRNGQVKESEGSEIRVSRLAEEVHEALRRLGQIEDRCSRLEAQDLDRSAVLLNAADKLNRASERYRKSRARDGEGSDDGEPGIDWFRRYYPHHRRGAGAEEDRPAVTEDGE
jgi:hypothetical protein